MKVAVWDTYVKRKDGRKMHFDIIVPEDINNEEIVYSYGMEYLKKRILNLQDLHQKNASSVT